MTVAVLRVRLHAPWVRSLKDKRQIVRSLSDRVRARFNASVAEVDEQDVHAFAVLGVACLAPTAALADSMLDSVLAFMEKSTDAEIVLVERTFY